MSNIRKWRNNITVETEVNIDIDDILDEIGEESVIEWLGEYNKINIDEGDNPEDVAKLVATHIWREDDRKRFIEKFKEITGNE